MICQRSGKCFARGLAGPVTPSFWEIPFPWMQINLLGIFETETCVFFRLIWRGDHKIEKIGTVTEQLPRICSETEGKLEEIPFFFMIKWKNEKGKRKLMWICYWIDSLICPCQKMRSNYQKIFFTGQVCLYILGNGVSVKVLLILVAINAQILLTSHDGSTSFFPTISYENDIYLLYLFIIMSNTARKDLWCFQVC